MPVSQRYCFGLAVLLGYLYIVLLPFKPYPLGWLLKPLPMLLYAWLAWRTQPLAAGRWLALGFVAAGLGDFFLDYGNRDGLFRQALLAFLLTQLAFIRGFVLLAEGRSWRLLWSLPALLYGAGMAAWMLPAAGPLQLPLAFYFICLLGMALNAARLERRPGPLWLGASLFLVADSLIGVNKFIQPFPHAVTLIVLCYFTGQTLIAWGLLRLKADSATSRAATVPAG
ncbi:MAG: lysoplasmalogenase [Pseudomonas sp.]